MAEMIVLSKFTEAIVSHAIQRISYLLIHEAISLITVKTDVEYLRNELLRMQSFLKTAYSEQEQDDRVRNWVAEIRNIACEIEDVVETYIVKVDSSFFHVLHLKKLRKKINSIKTKIEIIFKSKKNYGIELVCGDPTGRVNPTALERQRSLRRSYPDDNDEDDVISLDHSTTILKTKLMEDKDDRLCFVSIIRTGGLGNKTALAKKVYNDNDVKGLFDCCAWVFISQQFVSRDVFSEILMQVGFPQSQYPTHNEDLEYMLQERRRIREILNCLEEDDIADYIKERLKGKRYLVVLDDVWRIEDWDSLKMVFPRGKRGSKIVFTSRNKKVALYADPNSFTIEPRLLTLEESWVLLQRKAFPRDAFSEAGCPSQFEHTGKRLAMKCGGLPLAIVKLGGLLRTKKLDDEWREVEREVNLHMNRYGVEADIW